MESSGEDFVNLLKDLNCPGATGLQGEDVDWLWETSAENLMKWICSNITPTNCLTAEEAKRWREFPTEDILRGDKLQEALEDIVEDGEEQHKNLDEIRDELEIRQACVDDLKKVRSGLTTHQARLTLLVSNLNKKLEESESSLSREQRMFFKINTDLESVIGRLKSAINEANLQDSNFMIEQLLFPLFEENDKVRDLICQLIHKRLDEPLGRDIEEFEDLVAEIDRLRFSIKNMEHQQILSEAKCEGAKAGLEETKLQLKLLSQDMLPKDNINHEMSKIDTDIQVLQGELKSLSKDILPQVIEERVSDKCSKILSKDLKGKAERQNHILEQLELILNLLLELTSYHEVLGGWISFKSKLLQQLEQCLTAVQKFNSKARCDLDTHNHMAKELQEKGTMLKRSTLLPSGNLIAK